MTREQMIDIAVRRVYPLNIMRDMSARARVKGTSKVVLGARYWEACAEFRSIAKTVDYAELIGAAANDWIPDAIR